LLCGFISFWVTCALRDTKPTQRKLCLPKPFFGCGYIPTFLKSNDSSSSHGLRLCGGHRTRRGGNPTKKFLHGFLLLLLLLRP
jgi:hypothetical protein